MDWKLEGKERPESQSNEFKIEYRAESDRKEELKTEEMSDVVWQSSPLLLNQFEYEMAQLSPNRPYFVRIRGRNHALSLKFPQMDVWSKYSNILKVKTGHYICVCLISDNGIYILSVRSKPCSGFGL